MSEFVPNSPVPTNPPSAPLSEPAVPMSIFQAWVKALTSPSERTYAAIAHSPNASSTNAFVWYFVASLVSFIVAFTVGSSSQQQLLKDLGAGQELQTPSLAGNIGTVVCGAPIAALVAALFFAIFLGIMQLIARAFGGKATFDQLAYTIAAIVVPLAFVGAVFGLLSAIPYVGLCFTILNGLVGLYGLVLEIIAVKGVHLISWGGAVVSSVVLPIALCVCVACGTIAALMLLGPVIGNTFSTINSSLNSIP